MNRFVLRYRASKVLGVVWDIVKFLGIILFGLVLGYFSMFSAESGNVSIGVNGLVEKRCIDGGLYILADRGHIVQVVEEDGLPAKCN